MTGKTALVTGGATGIGRMAATALVRAGATVMIASRKGADCEKVAAELNALGAPGKAEGFAGDVSTEEGVLALARRSRRGPTGSTSCSTMPARPGARRSRNFPMRAGPRCSPST